MNYYNKIQEAKRNCTVIKVTQVTQKYLNRKKDVEKICSYIKKLISLNDDLRVCFDTNHLLIQKNSDFIKDLGDKIITLHVSDYDFRNEQHWLPYEGKVDWVELVTLLEEAGYNGAFLYEFAFTARDASLIRERDVVYKDFYENLCT